MPENRIWPLPRVEFVSLAEVETQNPVILVTTPGAWEAAAARLPGLKIACQVQVRQAAMPHWMELAAGLMGRPAGAEEALLAVGGGLAVDAAKYLAAQLGRPLACLPTALSVDAFFTWASGVRHRGCVEYLETQPPDELLIDLDFLAGAPRHLRAAGICDVLSIATGLWDWEFAEEAGRNPDRMELIPWAADAAMAILQGGLDCAEAAGAGDPGGLRQLLDCLALEVQLCNQLGHSRPEEGSEHYFAYLAENFVAEPLPHGALVGPGILAMAERQEGESTEMHQALVAAGVPLDRLTDAAVRRTLQELPGYARDHDLPYGIAHTLDEEA